MARKKKAASKASIAKAPSLAPDVAPETAEQTIERLKAELASEQAAHRETSKTVAVHQREAADAKMSAAETRKEVALLSPTQPHNGIPGWDRPLRSPPGLLNDRVRKPLFDQLMHALKTGRDMERGLRSTAKEILNRTKRLHPDKMTPHEAALHPLLLEAEARQWRPQQHKGHRLREHQPSKRKG